jgi:subtilisin family serine protease
LDVIDEETPRLNRRSRRPVATLEHWVHVAANGDGHACPAIEPEETDQTQAFPEANPDTNAGAGVQVVVIDTGWVNPPVDGAALPNLEEYDGHGSFIEQVIHCRAPGAKIQHIEFPVHPATHRNGGVVSEYVLADLLGQALDMEPDIINISAGCHRHNDLPFVGFRNEWRKRSTELRKKVAVVAAAGNDRSSSPFFPAANRFAIGVGSLDDDDAVSRFSNYRRSSDVFVLGGDHINEFPRGRYRCRWQPYENKERVFETGWARWSGTSFAAPLFAGLIAAKMQAGDSARQTAWDLIEHTAETRHRARPWGDLQVIPLSSPLY